VPTETKWLGKDSHVLNLSLGLATSAAVLLFQFLVDNERDANLEELEQTKILRVLQSRDDSDYYGPLISDAKQRVFVFGVTAHRFLIDFADTQHSEPRKRVVLDALNRNVDVRILVCKKERLCTNDEKAKFDQTRPILDDLSSRYPNNFKFAYYDHTPTLSMVICDNHFLFGPYFPGRQSKHTATIHALEGGSICQEYLAHFSDEWQKVAP
jgi:hypothetical protein